MSNLRLGMSPPLPPKREAKHSDTFCNTTEEKLLTLVREITKFRRVFNNSKKYKWFLSVMNLACFFYECHISYYVSMRYFQMIICPLGVTHVIVCHPSSRSEVLCDYCWHQLAPSMTDKSPAHFIKPLTSKWHDKQTTSRCVLEIADVVKYSASC